MHESKVKEYLNGALYGEIILTQWEVWHFNPTALRQYYDTSYILRIWFHTDQIVTRVFGNLESAEKAMDEELDCPLWLVLKL